MTKENAEDALARIGLWASRSEHYAHLFYFACLSTGFFNYEWAAGGCFFIGVIALLKAIHSKKGGQP